MSASSTDGVRGEHGCSCKECLELKVQIESGTAEVTWLVGEAEQQTGSLERCCLSLVGGFSRCPAALAKLRWHQILWAHHELERISASRLDEPCVGITTR